MKVCVVVTNSIWYDPRVRKQLLQYKQIAGIEVYGVGLKCSRYNKEKVESFPCKIYLADIDEKLKGKQSKILSKIARERQKWKYVYKEILREKPDVIHANDLDALIPAYMAQKKLKCKLIYDSHEIYVENNNFIGRKVLKFIYSKIEKHILKKVDLMVCVSNAAAEYFVKKYKIKKPLVVTNCAIQKEIYKGVEVKNEGFEVLNHGQFYAGRGYDIMIKACEYLRDYPEIKLAIRGFGTLEHELREKVEENGYNNFIFYQPVTVQELIPMAARSMVGVAITEPICLNFELSVSNKLFEYAAAGLPVIMSDIPEHRYLNEKYRFGIILKENTPHDLALAIKKLYTDKTFYELGLYRRSWHNG